MNKAKKKEKTTLGEQIQGILSHYSDCFKDYEEGAPDTRYKSWEWCHKAFIENRIRYRYADPAEQAKLVDYLALHLAFYLASWGMYRNSPLLKRDYKVHKNAVKCILEEKYELLWDYEPSKDNIPKAKELLFGLRDKENKTSQTNGIYYRIKRSYPYYKSHGKHASQTLTTKILLGTFGCVPAFDSYLTSGISNYKSHDGNCQLGPTIEDDGKTFEALADFAIDHKQELKVDVDFHYPPMKCVDMYFWEIGYELGLAKALTNSKENEKKKKEVLKRGASLGLYQQNASFEEAARQIKEKN